MLRTHIHRTVAQIKQEWHDMGVSDDAKAALKRDKAAWTGTGEWTWPEDEKPCRTKGCTRVPLLTGHCRKHARDAR